MKKILISSSIILAAAAIIAGGTYAYFSDTETSTGNTFTAGSLDLLINGHNSAPASIQVSDVKPGDTGSAQGTITNGGTVNGGVYLALYGITNNENDKNNPESKINNPAVETGDGDLCRNLKLDVYVKDQSSSDWGTPVWSPYAGNEQTSFVLFTLAAGQTKDYKVQYSIASSVGNEIQTDSCGFSYDAVLEQAH